MLAAVVRLVRERPDVLAKLQGRHRHVLVDEFQASSCLPQLSVVTDAEPCKC